jgi:curved DNA-binding protein CbpA
MTRERRNLYRLLHVQPESPPEVIKAAYRALMSTLRVHPDLGGSHEQAAQLNGAYAVLMDPERRRAYDLTLRRRPLSPQMPAAQAANTGAASPAPTPTSPAAWLTTRRCPFCHHGFSGLPKTGPRCARCDGPLTPLPKPSQAFAAEVLGRRNGEPRFARDLTATLQLPGTAQEHTGRLRDLSFNGFSLNAGVAVPPGHCVRVITPVFDALALAVAQRRVEQRWTLHAQLLTLELLRTVSTGVYVNTRA